MNVLVINCGSSSVKYRLMGTGDGTVMARGFIDRVGFDDSVFSHTTIDRRTSTQTLSTANHTEAIKIILNALVTGKTNVLGDLEDIGAVGHRFVNGGNRFRQSVIVDERIIEELRALSSLAPLHNPANLLGIEACRSEMPDTPQITVFDTAFHAQLPPKAYMYPLPYSYYERHGIRRYGFHGTSHFYVSNRAAGLLGRPVDELRIITCHLGNGCSIDAVRGGHAVDTSMGLTPLEGLMMGTRTGDIDAAVPLHIMRLENLKPEEMDAVLNKKSGLLGVSGVSSDMREVEHAARNGNERAALAFDMYCYRIKKYIASYAGILGGCDALVFTAGIGEHSPNVRRKSCKGLSFMGIELDTEKNEGAVGGESDISSADSRSKIFVIPTNEEIVIAREAERLVM